MNDESSLDSVQKKRIQEHLQKAVVLHRQGKLDTAFGQYLEVLKIDPENANANHLAGLVLLARKKAGDLLISLEYLTKAIKIDGNQGTFHNDLGNAYWNLGRISEAAVEFSCAIRLQPDFVQPRFNLGNCFWFQGRFRRARQAYADTLAVNKEWTQARYLLANCEYTLGNTDTAISIYRDVIAGRSNFTDARLGLAYALLRSGQWLEGWRFFESRLLFSEFSLYQESSLPQWDGRDLPGKSLLVFAEQGIGDTLHFARYLSLVRPKVGRLALVCDRSLHSLFASLAEIDDLLARNKNEVQSSEGNYDYRISLMSLPGLYRTTPDNMTWKVPYINTDIEKNHYWRNRIDSSKINVGLVWAGNPVQKDDKFRSCRLEHLLPLFQLPHIRYFSLQIGPARDQIQQTGCTSLVDIADELNTFADTAAVIANLDLVISVDTAVSHLAGALGKPVWTMLWYSHCWRYLENRTDSPWYPSMRLFRQREIGDWSHVVDQIGTALVDSDRNQTGL
ncbi:MAG: tetratricopeptide repeat protein [Gammaproteobacteria bacterium]|nr:MAG: tetratricopeptide repeat protein [Gammaproteobacteria bacterium]